MDPNGKLFYAKDTDNYRITRDDRGGIGKACNLDRSDLLLALRSKRNSVFDL